MRISDWSSDVCSSDLTGVPSGLDLDGSGTIGGEGRDRGNDAWGYGLHPGQYGMLVLSRYPIDTDAVRTFRLLKWSAMPGAARPLDPETGASYYPDRSEEHTSELQSLMRISYAVFCLKKKMNDKHNIYVYRKIQQQTRYNTTRVM